MRANPGLSGLLFLMLAAAIAACGDSSVCEDAQCSTAGGGGQGGVDGTGGLGGDPAQGGSAPNGGGGAGAGGEGGQGGAPPTAIEVDIEYRDDAGAALGGRTVLISDEEGGVVSQETLSINGMLHVSVFAGYQVTVFEDPSATDPTRYAHGAVVTPGTTTIRLLHTAAIPPNPSVGSMTVAVGCVECTLATEVVFGASCASPQIVPYFGAGQVTSTFTDYRGCPGKTTFDAYAVARNPDAVVAISRKLDIPISSGVHAIPSTEAPLPQSSLEWTIDGAPGGASSTRALYASSATSGGTMLFRDASAAAAVTMPVPDDYVSPGRLETTIFESATSQFSAYRRSFDVFDFSTVAFDVASLARPEDVTALDTTDPARPSFDWTLEAGPLGDLVQITMSSGESLGSTQDVIWTVASPAAASGTAKLPELPAELTDFAVDTSSTVAVAITQVDVYGTNGYETVLPSGVPVATTGPQLLTEYSFASDFSVF